MLQVAIFQALTLTAPDNVLALYAATSEQSSSVSESLPLWQLIAVRGTRLWWLRLGAELSVTNQSCSSRCGALPSKKIGNQHPYFMMTNESEDNGTHSLQSSLEASEDQLTELRLAYETYLRRMAQLLTSRTTAYDAVEQVRCTQGNAPGGWDPLLPLRFLRWPCTAVLGWLAHRCHELPSSRSDLLRITYNRSGPSGLGGLLAVSVASPCRPATCPECTHL